jgi:GAF domain
MPHCSMRLASRRSLCSTRGKIRWIAKARLCREALDKIGKVVSKLIGRHVLNIRKLTRGANQNATRVCGSSFGTLYLREGDAFAVSMHGATPTYMRARLGQLLQPGPETGIGRAVRTKDVVHIPDATADPAYRQGDPMRVEAVDVGGVRTLLDVPMLKENEVIGDIAIYRREGAWPISTICWIDVKSGKRVPVPLAAVHMSLPDTERTSQPRGRMSAFGGEADLG